MKVVFIELFVLDGFSMLSATAKNKNLQFFNFLSYIVLLFVSTTYIYIFCIFYFKAVFNNFN